VAGGPRLGDLEAGVVATAFGDTVSVVSGGLACVAGALLVARLLPGFRKQRSAMGASGRDGTGGTGEAAARPGAGAAGAIGPAEAVEPTEPVDVAEQEA
jgi:hypothetical protein